jgi:SAM-dependent methyltransferase
MGLAAGRGQRLPGVPPAAAKIRPVRRIAEGPLKEFYESYYLAVDKSQAHHAFCERVFGQDLCQHGFVDQAQLELLLQVIQLDSNQQVLDLGCGNGMIAEYLSDRTGAHLTGLDYIAHAISQARGRTIGKAGRLAFLVGDINQLDLPRNAFDVVLSLDSLYFSRDYATTIRELKLALRTGAQMAIFFSYGREPWAPRGTLPREMLAADTTPLAQALRANGLTFRTWDLTRQDYELALRRKAVLAELKPQFMAEGHAFIYENRLGDAEGICQAIEDGLHARYLYHVVVQNVD